MVDRRRSVPALMSSVALRNIAAVILFLLLMEADVKKTVSARGAANTTSSLLLPLKLLVFKDCLDVN